MSSRGDLEPTSRERLRSASCGACGAARLCDDTENERRVGEVAKVWFPSRCIADRAACYPRGNDAIARAENFLRLSGCNLTEKSDRLGSHFPSRLRKRGYVSKGEVRTE